MAQTSSFGFTNVTEDPNKVSGHKMDMLSKYAKTSDEPTVAVLANKTAPLDQGEWVTYRCNKIGKINVPGSVVYPAKVQDNNVQVVVKCDEILRTKDGTTGEVICDEPMSVYLTVKAPLSSHVTDSVITTLIARVIGAFQKADGTWRFNDLLRSALTPVED